MATGLSEVFVEALARAARAIVRVEGRRGYALSGVAWSADLVVTTRRAVERDDDVRIGLEGGDTAGASVVGFDPRIDLAVVRVEGGGLQPVGWIDAAGSRVGEVVLLAGRPAAAVRASLGIVAVSEGEWNTGAGGRVERLLQSDARPFPGFSGGPLLTEGGDVLGVNTASFSREGSMTLPAETVRRTVETIEREGRVRRGYLGVAVQRVRLPEGLQEGGEVAGLLIVAVEPGSPAADAGLSLGDTLLAVDGKRISHPLDLGAYLDGSRIGGSLALRFARGGEIREVAATVAERS